MVIAYTVFESTISYYILKLKCKTNTNIGGSHLIFGIRKIGRMEDGKGEKYPSTHTPSRWIHKIRWISQYSGRSVGFHYDFEVF